MNFQNKPPTQGDTQTFRIECLKKGCIPSPSGHGGGVGIPSDKEEMIQMTIPHIVKDAIGTACSKNNITLSGEAKVSIESVMETWATYQGIRDLSKVNFDRLVEVATEFVRIYAM